MSILLLSCCAPCSCGIIKKLADDGVEFSVLFYNPNIRPYEEYRKRCEENKYVCEKYGIKFIELEYDNDRWCELTSGLEHLPERQKRCSICFGMRLRRAFEYAKENGFEAVASVLGVSRYKDLNQVNEAAHAEAKRAGMPYIEIEGRKGGMQELRNQLIKELALYNQDYCGCKPRENNDVFSNWFLPKPYNEGYLPEENGHKVYFAEYGNKNGKPVLVFHGGPGGSCKARHVKGINLKKYRVITLDQRGCGLSLPLGKIEHNSTQELLKDYDRLINHLNIDEKIILRGGSWGSTIALLWAERNPQKVKKMLLSQIFLANDDFHKWEFDGTKYIYPEFVECMEKKSKGNIISYYNKLIQSPNKKEQLKAINEFGWYERICGSINPKFASFSDVCDKELASNRIYMHYAANNFFLKENDILKNISKIKDVETVIVHNRLDLICPFKGAYDLHKKLNNSELFVIDEFGHVGDKIRKAITTKLNKVLK